MRHQAALRLRDDLLGDDDDVAVAQLGSVGVRRTRPPAPRAAPGRSPGATSPTPVTGRRDLARLSHRHRSRSGRALRRTCSGVLMTCRCDHAAHARAPRPRPPGRVGLVDDQGARPRSAYRRATPTTDGSVPSSAISRSAGPFSAAPATIGETATTSLASAPRASRMPGHGEDRADGDDRVRRADHDPLAPAASASSTPGAGRAPSRAVEPHAASRRRRGAAGRSSPGTPTSVPAGPSTVASANVRRRADRVVGDRQEPHLRPRAARPAPRSPR